MLPAVLVNPQWPFRAAVSESEAVPLCTFALLVKTFAKPVLHLNSSCARSFAANRAPPLASARWSLDHEANLAQSPLCALANPPRETAFTRPAPAATRSI